MSIFIEKNKCIILNRKVFEILLHKKVLTILSPGIQPRFTLSGHDLDMKTFFGGDALMPTTKNIERQMVSVGDPISLKNARSGFTWDSLVTILLRRTGGSLPFPPMHNQAAISLLFQIIKNCYI